MPQCVEGFFLHLIVLRIPSFSTHASERSFFGKEMQCAGNCITLGGSLLAGVYFGSDSMSSESGKNDLLQKFADRSE